MKVLFIHKSLAPIGGIETLIVRLLQYASKTSEVSISLLLYDHHDKNSELLKSIEHCAANLKVYSSSLGITALPIKPLFIEGAYDLIYCFGWRSLIVGLLTRQTFFPNAKLGIGVYQSREFCWDFKFRSFGQRLVRDIFRKIPKNNIVFMNKGCKYEHEKVLGLDFSMSPIVPLGVCINFGEKKRDVQLGRIVSVGRLTDFKTYNSYMIDVIKTLRTNTGVDFEYHVYGGGEMLESLISKVERLGLQDVCYFHGHLEYSELPAIFRKAWCFVGMGTALIESAANGVPSIVAIESETRPITYGFIHELDTLNCGEQDEKLQTDLIENKIMHLYKMNHFEYSQLEEVSRQAMKQYDINTVILNMLQCFHAFCEDEVRLSIADRLLDSISGIFWKVVAHLGLRSPLKNRYLRK